MFVFEFVFEILFGVGCVLTGHCVLWVLTLGQWQPLKNSDDAALVVGVLFWIAVGIGVWLTFFR